MKRKFKLSFLITIIIAIILFLTFHLNRNYFLDDHYTIAVVGPIDGVNKKGNAIWNGVSLCIDEINEKGGVGGRKIKLIAFNDQDDRKVAIKIAEEIAENKKINLVLGNNLSSTSNVAGLIYKKNGIAAITGSANSLSVTKNNEWFFRVISNTAFQGRYIANFMSKNLNIKKVSIIYDRNSTGTEISENFESQAKNLGIEIMNKWSFDSEKTKNDTDSFKLELEIQKIVSEVLSTKDPGMIFLGMLNTESVLVLKYLRSLGIKHKVFLGDEFTSKSFQMFQELPKEKAIPGYYSNGVYTVTPFLAEVGNEKAKNFVKKFRKKYSSEPTWHSATYYDAALVAVEAIKNAEIINMKRYKQTRILIREFLDKIDNYEQGINGVTQKIYFDSYGDANGPLAIGVYDKNKLNPAFHQYKLIDSSQTSNEAPTETFEKTLDGELVDINGKIMKEVRVVFTGIDINRISYINYSNFDFTADFYIWFRFKKELDDSNIEFDNSILPFKLENKIVESFKDGVHTRTYHVKNTFRANFDFKKYPFDRQILPLRFHHKTLMKNKIIYSTDVAGLVKKRQLSEIDISKENTGSKFLIKSIKSYEDFLVNRSTLGEVENFLNLKKLAYSRFNTLIEIEKKDNYFKIFLFLPLALISVFLYIQLFFKGKKLGLRFSILLVSLFLSVSYQAELKYSLKVDYFTAVDYAIIGLYGFIFLVLLELILLIHQEEEQYTKFVKYYFIINKYLMPIPVISLIMYYLVL